MTKNTTNSATLEEARSHDVESCTIYFDLACEKCQTSWICWIVSNGDPEDEWSRITTAEAIAFHERCKNESLKSKLKNRIEMMAELEDYL